MDLYREFEGIVSSLESAGCRYALIGGLAVGIHGYVRATKDMDFLLYPDDLTTAAAALGKLGYRQSSDPWTFKDSNLTLWRFLKPIGGSESFYMVDILVAETERDQAIIARAESQTFRDGQIKVAQRADLILMKQGRGSAQDLADIENLNRENSGG